MEDDFIPDEDFQPDPPEMQLGPEKIPKYLKYSSKMKDNDIEQVRQRLRLNKIHHLKFEPFLENSDGLQYFYKIYEANNPEHIEGTKENMATSKNLYAYNLERGLHKEAR